MGFIKLLNTICVCPFDYTGVWVCWACKPVNHTSCVVVVTQTERPKKVHNHCVIELFRKVFVLSVCLFDLPVGTGAFVTEKKEEI